MTLQEIKDRVANIESISGDDEAAHAQEDRLYEDFILYVASCNHDYPGLAKKAAEVLKTKDINFSRWCA